jgi:hypothetical protein
VIAIARLKHEKTPPKENNHGPWMPMAYHGIHMDTLGSSVHQLMAHGCPKKGTPWNSIFSSFLLSFSGGLSLHITTVRNGWKCHLRSFTSIYVPPLKPIYIHLLFSSITVRIQVAKRAFKPIHNTKMIEMLKTMGKTANLTSLKMGEKTRLVFFFLVRFSSPRQDLSPDDRCGVSILKCQHAKQHG